MHRQFWYNILNSLNKRNSQVNGLGKTPTEGNSWIYLRQASWLSRGACHQQAACRDSSCQARCNIGCYCHGYWDDQAPQEPSPSKWASRSSNACSCWYPHLQKTAHTINVLEKPSPVDIHNTKVLPIFITTAIHRTSLAAPTLLQVQNLSMPSASPLAIVSKNKRTATDYAQIDFHWHFRSCANTNRCLNSRLKQTQTLQQKVELLTTAC